LQQSKKFSWQECAKQTYALYKKVIYENKQLQIIILFCALPIIVGLSYLLGNFDG
jgi:hypothetical protein